MHRGDGKPHGNARFDKQGFAQLQARLGGFRHGLGNARDVKLHGMALVTGAGDDLEIGPLGPRCFGYIIDADRIVHGDRQCPGFSQPAFAQEFRISGIAVIDRETVAAFARNQFRILVDGDVSNLVFVEQRANQVANAAEARNDNTRLVIGGERHYGFFRTCQRLPHDIGNPAADAGEQWYGDHGDGDDQQGIAIVCRR